MSDSKQQQNKGFSPDWLVRGVLTKLGDTFDRLTGRGWKPSSSLATSELIERLKKLMDSEVRDEGAKGKFVPHRVKLKMQWDKFSTDADDAIKKLENELLTAAIDHINDNLYHTYAPLRLEIKPDYFTEGVKLLTSFDEFDEEPHEAELNVTVPHIDTAGLIPGTEAVPPPVETLTDETYEAVFSTDAGRKRVTLVFSGSRRLSVGRTGTNNLVINDHSVSKIHASLFLNPESGLMVADTGSTNGTFINGERISYGKAFAVADGAIARFGSVDVVFDHIEKPPPAEENVEAPESDAEETVAIGEFEFKRKQSDTEQQDTLPIEEAPGEVADAGHLTGADPASVEAEADPGSDEAVPAAVTGEPGTEKETQ